MNSPPRACFSRAYVVHQSNRRKVSLRALTPESASLIIGAQVNASPSLTCTTEADRKLKQEARAVTLHHTSPNTTLNTHNIVWTPTAQICHPPQVIWDALAIGVPADFLQTRQGPDQCPAPQRSGSFQLLVDEANPRAKVVGSGLFF